MVVQQQNDLENKKLSMKGVTIHLEDTLLELQRALDNKSASRMFRDSEKVH